MWFPKVRFRNDSSPRDTSNIKIYNFNDGTILYRETFLAHLEDEMEIKAIPFDTQTVVMNIGSLT